MASSRLRTYPGKPRKNDSRSTAADWLQRDTIAEAYNSLAHSYQSVISCGEMPAITVAKGEGNRPNLSVQTQHLARAERLPDPANAGIVKPAGARHRGLYER